ncbi:MAG: TIGR00730 family Rossman fold protein [Ruminococcaceae bacterium]|nr:TIGR00730 family Rossman fold protein [Oscillospiraceae bacterium]
MTITVYLGSTEGRDPAFKTAVRELGTWIGANGHSLVYGGSKCGLMGELAESVLQAGGEVTGVEPQFFIDAGLEYDAITRLIVTQDMSERRAKMIELGDAFIAFPGGVGTLEEISEVINKKAMRHLDAPCILYNLNGYYNDLHAMLDHMVEMELCTKEKLRGVCFADGLAQIRDILKG